jgi:hypothetical protein
VQTTEFLVYVLRLTICFYSQLGKSGAGKTSAIVACLLAQNGPKFRSLFIITKTPHQLKYKFIKKVAEGVPNLKVVLSSDPNVLPNNDKFPPDSIIIFDDFSCDTDFLNRISSLITYSRHYCVSLFIISHSWTKLNKALIRSNCNFIIIFPCDLNVLKQIFEEHLSNILTFEKLRKVAKIAWTEFKTFLLADLEASSLEEQIRIGFDQNVEL